VVGMQINRFHVRKVALYLAGIAIAVALVAPAGQFFISLADERGWYKNPNAKVATVIAWINTTAASPWFHWIAGSIVGFAIGVWLDALLKRRDEASTPKPNLQHKSITKISDIEPFDVPILLRLQFHGGQVPPTEIRSENVLVWYVVWNGEAVVDFGLPGGFRIPKSWTIFVAFDKPSTFRQMIVQPAIQDFPNYQIKWASTTHVVITTSGDIAAGVLDIYSKH
jgi:hypothetical protein